MGYFAIGRGDAALKEGVDTSVIMTLLEDLHKRGAIGNISWETSQGIIWFYDETGHWDELQTKVFLSAIAPYIEEGCMNYSCESDGYWRYVFNPKTVSWEEQAGVLSFDMSEYSDETLIKELTKRGYPVSAKNDTPAKKPVSFWDELELKYSPEDFTGNLGVLLDECSEDEAVEAATDFLSGVYVTAVKYL